ncbi:MAG TPA: threonine synthase [Acidimicrobiia bacterium]|nr:threonine synthase [Acidimicrobiia bacterium]
MRYLSTRGDPERSGFAQVLLEGLAPDGGLYVPEAWPSFTDPSAATYPDLVTSTLGAFTEPDFAGTDLEALVAEAYRDFTHPQVAPLRQVSDTHYLLELIFGPTRSFKDYALVVLSRLFDAELARQGRRILVLGATSGDTGSAAMAACRGRQNIEVVILYPEGKISEIQRRQMTTIPDANVRAVGVEGTFDDCQALVKRAFNDRSLELPLAAINSINWARIAVQAAYYLWAARQVAAPVTFAVPTGNFGNAFAAFVARQMGAPISRIVVANNRNHGLFTLIDSGELPVEPVQSTVAPAMDIQLPSNLERYLFFLTGQDPTRVTGLLAQLASENRLVLHPQEHGLMKELFAGGWIDDTEVLAVIDRVETSEGLLLDPHTAIAWEVGKRLQPSEGSLVTIATAHPAKFGETILAATGRRPALPAELASLSEREERLATIPNDYPALLDLLSS